MYVYYKRTHFQGEIVNGEYHGEGTYTWPDGSYFSGPFLHNKYVCINIAQVYIVDMVHVLL